ncbi:MAG: hypothetical protein EA419_02500 [Wenzhouxiangella sp.]|nr:MAG: hypothetical protein EA419_02500 [Wenzhouxiangella sp.]
MRTLVDGQPGTVVPVDDRAFLYGESLFETVAFRDRQAPLWSRHMARLDLGCRSLGFQPPRPEQLLAECRKVLPESGPAIARITITGGSGGRGYWPAPDAPERRVIQCRDWPGEIDRQRSAGLRLTISKSRLESGPVGEGLKHGNRLVQVMAARECARSGHDEAVLLDQAGSIVEAISSNILLVVDDQLMTHPRPVVSGVGLGWLIDQPGLDLRLRPVAGEDLARCSEVLVINSVSGVRPAIAIEQYRFRPGPTCRHLQSLWNEQLI